MRMNFRGLAVESDWRDEALRTNLWLIPAIESGWIESVHCFGGEVGMEEYVRARSDIFFVGHDGSRTSP